MNKRRFFVQLTILTFVLTAVVLGLQTLPAFRPHTFFSLISIGFFVLLSIAMFFMAAKAAVSKDKHAFTRLIMLFTLSKMILTAVLVIVYKQVAEPKGLVFVLPFFLIYIAYTVFETMFMTKLGKIKAR
ncbi:MAG TPA: hypothetical protein ENJ95_20830 [Bacteroidetes bacterium]|nr:hypothetical protein [Bacteroidota bacterium]